MSATVLPFRRPGLKPHEPIPLQFGDLTLYAAAPPSTPPIAGTIELIRAYFGEDDITSALLATEDLVRVSLLPESRSTFLRWRYDPLLPIEPPDIGAAAARLIRIYTEVTA